MSNNRRTRYLRRRAAEANSKRWLVLFQEFRGAVVLRDLGVVEKVDAQAYAQEAIDRGEADIVFSFRKQPVVEELALRVKSMRGISGHPDCDTLYAKEGLTG